jgi:P pilus assembly chaperone PapD
MRVDAAEAEGADGGTARRSFIALPPLFTMIKDAEW